MELSSTAEVERRGLSQGGRALWDYWNALPKLGTVPFRSDFDPAAVVRLLPFISIVERRSADDWRIRLAGTDVGRQAGMETTGLNYLDLVDPTLRSTLATILANIVSRPCAYRGIPAMRLSWHQSRPETFGGADSGPLARPASPRHEPGDPPPSRPERGGRSVGRARRHRHELAPHRRLELPGYRRGRSHPVRLGPAVQGTVRSGPPLRPAGGRGRNRSTRNRPTDTCPTSSTLPGSRSAASRRSSRRS